MKRWDALVYAFFKPIPAIEYVDGRKAHIFECAATSCHQKTKYIYVGFSTLVTQALPAFSVSMQWLARMTRLLPLQC
jgi:hypothetical protein